MGPISPSPSSSLSHHHHSSIAAALKHPILQSASQNEATKRHHQAPNHSPFTVGSRRKKNPPYLPNLSQAAKRYPVLLWSHPNPSSPSRNPPLSSDLSLLTHCPVPDIWNPQKWNASLGTAATACMSSATSLSLQGILVHLLLLQ